MNGFFWMLSCARMILLMLFSVTSVAILSCAGDENFVMLGVKEIPILHRKLAITRGYIVAMPE